MRRIGRFFVGVVADGAGALGAGLGRIAGQAASLSGVLLLI